MVLNARKEKRNGEEGPNESWSEIEVAKFLLSVGDRSHESPAKRPVSLTAIRESTVLADTPESTPPRPTGAPIAPAAGTPSRAIIRKAEPEVVSGASTTVRKPKRIRSLPGKLPSHLHETVLQAAMGKRDASGDLKDLGNLKLDSKEDPIAAAARLAMAVVPRAAPMPLTATALRPVALTTTQPLRTPPQAPVPMSMDMDSPSSPSSDSKMDSNGRSRSSIDSTLQDRADKGVLTPEEERIYKRQRRLERNREAAQRSRQNKKAYVDGLEGKIKEIQDTNDQLEAEIREACSKSDRVKQTTFFMRWRLFNAGVKGSSGKPPLAKAAKTAQVAKDGDGDAVMKEALPLNQTTHPCFPKHASPVTAPLVDRSCRA
eukprot:GFYU01000356.1.p1 GENE.GFYU01000356.1~~GFYU01000356.1.p1  ORF type:complete len:383 (+),score=100.92 GFYU01000356.1:32-1150(+)